MQMVCIIDTHGEKNFVNPEYVTSVIPKKGKDLYQKDTKWTEVWVKGQSGYGTFSIHTDEEPAVLAKRLDPKMELAHA